MIRGEVALICKQLQADLEAIRYLLNGPSLEEGHYILIRACVAHIASFQGRLAVLVGANAADYILHIVYQKVLNSELRRGNTKHG